MFCPSYSAKRSLPLYWDRTCGAAGMLTNPAVLYAWNGNGARRRAASARRACSIIYKKAIYATHSTMQTPKTCKIQGKNLGKWFEKAATASEQGAAPPARNGARSDGQEGEITAYFPFRMIKQSLKGRFRAHCVGKTAYDTFMKFAAAAPRACLWRAALL